MNVELIVNFFFNCTPELFKKKKKTFEWAQKTKVVDTY